MFTILNRDQCPCMCALNILADIKSQRKIKNTCTLIEDLNCNSYFHIYIYNLIQIKIMHINQSVHFPKFVNSFPN